MVGWCQLGLNWQLSILIFFTSLICENNNFIWGQTTHGKISTILIKLVKTRLMNIKFISSTRGRRLRNKKSASLERVVGASPGRGCEQLKRLAAALWRPALVCLSSQKWFTHIAHIGTSSVTCPIISGDLILTMIAVIYHNVATLYHFKNSKS